MSMAAEAVPAAPPAVPAPAAPPAVPVPAPPAPVPVAEPVAAPAVAAPVVAPSGRSGPEFEVERLQSSAYPEPQIRGLPYGSLALTFHGLQWPYLPAPEDRNRIVIGVSGWGWIDNSYEKFGPWGNNTQGDSSRIKYWKQQSRLLARLTPTYSFSDGFFMQGQAEFVATGDQTVNRGDLGGADTDDLWLRIGHWNKWDVQVGRFEGWEVFHLGMGLDQNTFERNGAVGRGESQYNIQFYGLTDNQFRPPGAAGNFAWHYYPLPFLRVELLGMAGSLSAGNAYAARPVAILDLGWVKVKAGTEYQSASAQLEGNQSRVVSRGLGGALQFVLNPHVELGFNAAQGTVVTTDSVGRQDPKASLTRTSFGGFANFSNGNRRHPVLVGIGSIFTRNVDQNDALGTGQVDNYWHSQSFIAIQYVLMQQFYIKLVGGYAHAHWSVVSDPPIVFDDEMYSARLRFSYYF